jgi:hypothetical protein
MRDRGPDPFMLSQRGYHKSVDRGSIYPRLVVHARNSCANEGSPFHTWKDPGGSICAAFYRTPGGLKIHFPNFADFDISSDNSLINCSLYPGTSNATIEHLYVNQILPLFLSQLGKYVFHGSAIETAEGALAFLGRSGLGKSTLAASFAARGQRFLTDDALVLEPTDDGYLVQPGHPSLRLWDDTHMTTLKSEVSTARPVDYPPKTRIGPGPSLPHCDRERPLQSAYFLGPREVASERICFERLTPAEALIDWTRNSFLLDIEDRALVGAHFDKIAVLANSVPCFRFYYPRRYEAMQRVLDALLAHQEELVAAA